MPLAPMDDNIHLFRLQHRQPYRWISCVL